MNTVQAGTTAVPGLPGAAPHSCPACGQRGALIALGERYERPHRWRPWVIRTTPLALCGRCDAIVALEQTRQPIRESLPDRLVPAPVVCSAI